MSEHKICDIIFSDFLVQMEEFHGYRSPGILVGGLMLDVALREMKQTPYLNVVTETVCVLAGCGSVAHPLYVWKRFPSGPGLGEIRINLL